jgi:hypothetical protein
MAMKVVRVKREYSVEITTTTFGGKLEWRRLGARTATHPLHTPDEADRHSADTDGRQEARRAETMDPRSSNLRAPEDAFAEIRRVLNPRDPAGGPGYVSVEHIPTYRWLWEQPDVRALVPADYADQLARVVRVPNSRLDVDPELKRLADRKVQGRKKDVWMRGFFAVGVVDDVVLDRDNGRSAA